MMRTKPPFRADHVGSLLRSGALRDARAKREKSEITADRLKAVEDREIEALIKKQEDVGLKSVTDGEYRRASWQTDFLQGARRRRVLRRRTRVPVSRCDVAADSAARQQEARRLHAASDDRALQVRRCAHQGDAENDDPVAVDAALPLRPQGGAGGDLSDDGRVLPRPRSDLVQGGARASPTPDAATFSSTRPI